MYFEIDQAACIDILRRLICAQADGEGAVQAVVEDALTACGASVRRMHYEPSNVPLTGEFAARDVLAGGERLTLLGTCAGSGGGRSLILFAHPDSEPVAGTERWTREPFLGFPRAAFMAGAWLTIYWASQPDSPRCAP